MKKSIKKERLRNLTREYTHPSYTFEVKLLNEMRLGLLDQAIQTMDTINTLERATLSKNKIRSKRNSLIIWCSLFTRSAIEAGVNYEDAFALSDILINTIDDTQDNEKLMTYEYHMINEFISLIQDFHQEAYPYPVSKIIKYINAHANEKLTVNKLADIFDLHPDYLSKLFKKEVGINLTTYIQNKKTELAKNFLTYSQMTVTEIATLLDFSSHNYFSRTFRRVTNMTPLAFRKSTMKYENE
ncbi:MAG: AraC family transcriptional regulator [Vallitaleaceae bacterium]|nr:AraC family transcriptional regulator [Vallitaleaceae bacterium]